jgi:hypothetical protein
MESNMPCWKDEVRKRLAELKLGPAREVEIVEELAEHMEDRYQEHLLIAMVKRKRFAGRLRN